MDRTGQPLENLVRDIERYLLPHGFSVEARKRVYDDTGTQVAEFDLVISGKLGSSSVSWLIECRDRPSEGPAPGSWIEQLVSRRRRFNFDKVIAVSSTGFAPGAAQYAEREGVVLRTVEAIEDISTDFQLANIQHGTYDVTPLGPISVRTTNPQDRRFFNVDVNALKFTLADGTDVPSFYELVLRALLTNPNLKLGEDRDFNYMVACEGPLECHAGDETIHLVGLQAPVRVVARFHRTTALTARKYAEGNRLIGAEGTAEFVTPDGKFKTRIQIFNKDDGTFHVLATTEQTSTEWIMGAAALFYVPPNDT